MNLFGPTRDRNRKLEWMHTILCPECQKAAAEEARKKKAGELGMPELKGTEKQVAWAEKIRLEIFGMTEDPLELKLCEREGITKENYEKGMEYAFGKDKASWWIDNRSSRLSDFLAAALKELRRDEVENSPEAKAAKEAMTTMEPEDKQTSTVVAISAYAGSLLCRSDKDDIVRSTLKAHGFTWDGAHTAWTKKATEMTGPMRDLACNTARILLEAGVPVRGSVKMKEAVEKGDYEKETRRWICRARKEDFLLVAKVQAVKNYPQGRMTYDGDVLVRPALWREIREFAELNGYKITKAAEEELKKAEAETVAVSPAAKTSPEEGREDGLKAILESSRDVLEDLKEEE